MLAKVHKLALTSHITGIGKLDLLELPVTSGMIMMVACSTKINTTSAKRKTFVNIVKQQWCKES